MKFKYSAIGKNTAENREHLEKLGYKPLEIDESDSMLYTKLFPNGWMFSTMWNFPFPKHYIDCRSNFELFKAVSTVRSDSDFMQWFVTDFSNKLIPTEPMYLSENKYFNGVIIPHNNNIYIHEDGFHIGSTGFHKATLTELQERFKLK